MSTPFRVAEVVEPEAEPVEFRDPRAWEKLSEDKLAQDLGAEWEDARHVADWGRWLFFDGATWREDRTLEHMTRCREFLRDLSRRVAQDALDDTLKGNVGDPNRAAKAKKAARQAAAWLRSARTVAAVAGLARSNPEQAATTEQWDADPMLLGGPVTVDLKTGRTFAPRLADYITKATACAPAEPGTPAPLWTKFLDRVTDGDRDLQAYLQRLAGYCLTGNVDEHILVFSHGGGGNGKTTFWETLLKILGDYSCSIPTEQLMVSNSDRHPTEVARLMGVRLALGSEVEIGRTWAESKVKALTGGDRLQGRFMRQDFFEFAPQFKLCVFGNHRPSFRGVDGAIKRRLHLVPFVVTITPAERIGDLKEKLRAEWPAILRWAVDGCLEWQRGGLQPPRCVVEATEQYLSAEDAIARWIEERCAAEPGGWATIAELYGSYQSWCTASGEPAMSKGKLGQELQDRGFRPGRKTGGVRGYHGLTVYRVEN